MINEPKNVFALEAAVADALATNAVLLPQNLGTNQLDYYWKKFGSGLGTQASPAIGWESQFPHGQYILASANVVYGVTNSGGLAFGLGHDDSNIQGRWATLKWAGQGTTAALVSFVAPSSSANVLERCRFMNWYLDCRGSTATNEALIAFNAQSSHRMAAECTVIGAGTSATTAFNLVALTDFFSPGLICDSVANPGSVTNFTTGLKIKGLHHAVYGEVGMALPHIKSLIGGVKGIGWDIDGTFGGSFQGGCESTGSWGAQFGSAVAGLHLDSCDWEACGPIGFNGSHGAIRIMNGANGLNFNECRTFDGFMQFDAGCKAIFVLGGSYGGGTNSSTGGIYLRNVTGMNPNTNVRSFAGVMTNVEFVGRPDGGAIDIRPNMIIGSNGELSGWQTDDTGFGFPALLNAANGGIGDGTRYVLASQSGAAGVTLVNGAGGEDFRVGNTTVMQIRSGGITGLQPYTGSFGSPMTVTAVGPVFDLHNTDTGGSATTLKLRSDRTGHVQEWDIQLGAANFNGFAIFDATHGDLPLLINEFGQAGGQVDMSVRNVLVGPLQLTSFTVATLPTGVNGRKVFASNGRKIGEGAGSGTGVEVTYSNGQWRLISNDTVVAA